MKHDHLHVGYIIALILALSLYAGCSSGQTTAQASNYRFGSEALRMQFAPGTPTQAYVGDELVMILQLSNKGTADISAGQLYLSGFDPTYLDLQVEPSPVFNLQGKDQFDPNGDFTDIFTLRASRVRGPKNVDRFPQTVQVTACYDYHTSAIANVCIDSDPYNRLSRAKACTSSSVSVGGQGQPVVVTSVEPTVTRDSVRFNIRVSNSGSGIVYDRSRTSQDTCAQGPDYSSLNRISPPRVRLGGVTLDCSSDMSGVWLNGGSGSFSCECASGSSCVDPSVPAYRTLLEIDFDYGYRNTISSQLSIVNPN